MLRLPADENFNGDILHGLLRRNPQVDIVRVQYVGLSGANDPAVLEWAATENRVVVTRDVSTLAGHAFARVAEGNPMPGVFVVPLLVAVGRAIDDLLSLTECSHSGEWDGRVQPAAVDNSVLLLRADATAHGGDRTGLSSVSSTLCGEFQYARQQRSGR